MDLLLAPPCLGPPSASLRGSSGAETTKATMLCRYSDSPGSFQYPQGSAVPMVKLGLTSARVADAFL